MTGVDFWGCIGVSIQKNTMDFLNPILFMLTYRLRDPGRPTIRPGDPISDINNHPISNVAASQHNISVTTFLKSISVFADRRCDSFSNGNWHRIRVGLVGGWA